MISHEITPAHCLGLSISRQPPYFILFTVSSGGMRSLLSARSLPRQTAKSKGIDMGCLPSLPTVLPPSYRIRRHCRSHGSHPHRRNSSPSPTQRCGQRRPSSLRRRYIHASGSCRQKTTCQRRNVRWFTCSLLRRILHSCRCMWYIPAPYT